MASTAKFSHGSSVLEFPKLPRLGARHSIVSACSSRPSGASATTAGREIIAAAAQALVDDPRDGRRGSLDLRDTGVSLNLSPVVPRGSLTERGPLTARTLLPAQPSLSSRVTSSPLQGTCGAAVTAGVGPPTMPMSVRGRRHHHMGEEERQIRRVCEQIGQKASQKFTSVREAFRFVDADKDGYVDQSEMRYFFRAYDLPENVADQFFAHLDRDKSGRIDYDEFVSFMAPVISHGRPPSTNSGCSTREPSPPRQERWAERLAAVEREFGPLMRVIEIKAAQRFSHARQLFRLVDGNKDGFISRSEVKHLFRAFNLPEIDADRIFDILDEEASGELEFDEFVRLLLPHLDLPGVAAIQASAAPRPWLASAVSSRNSSRPNSSKDGRAWGSSPRPDSESSSRDSAESRRSRLPSHPLEAHGAAELQREMRDLMLDIRRKLPLKFRHVRDAFLPLDVARDGRITPSEMRSFIRGFGWSEDVADHLFALLDADGRGEVDYADFMSYFEPVLGPAHSPAPRQPTVRASASKCLTASAAADAKLKREVNEVAGHIGERLITKFRTAREGFRTLGLNSDGCISREEMRRFFQRLGMPLDAGDRFFKLLAPADGDAIAFDDFVALFGPVGDRSTRWQAVEGLRDQPRGW